MSNSLLYFTQRVYGFQHVSFDFNSKPGTVFEKIKRKDIRCPKCNGSGITASFLRTREIKAMKIGRCNLCFLVDIHRIYCQDCGVWKVEKTALFKLTKIQNDKRIGKDNNRIAQRDEHQRNFRIFQAVVACCEKCREGKGAEALGSFTRSLRRSRCKIKAIAMDMSKAYISWAKENIPDADIVFDHFYMIKMMNDKLDKVRRKVTKSIDEEHGKLLKKSALSFFAQR